MDLRKTLDSYPQVFVVCDRTVEAFARLLGDYPTLTLYASESTKTPETAVEICRWLLEHGADRDALVIAVGGGVTTDLVGFAASIYKRGIRYANVPTTLLAMVDAGLGGKTGVNLDDYKNMLGSFRQPEFTWLLPDVLRSLPRREFLSGAAEMLKTFIIENREDGYARTVKLLSAFASTGVSPVDTAAGLEELSALISAASAVKQDIVNRDPLERGERRVLNLGHTWAHAIEWWQHQPAEAPAASAGEPRRTYTHGEAVAIGIVAAARKAEELGIAEALPAPSPASSAPRRLSEKLAADFAACGLPTELPCGEEALAAAMARDKKAEASKGSGSKTVNYVLPLRIGKVVVKALPIFLSGRR